MVRRLVPVILFLVLFLVVAQIIASIASSDARVALNAGMNQPFGRAAAADASGGGLVGSTRPTDGKPKILFSEGLYADSQDALRHQLETEVLPYVLGRLAMSAPRRGYTLAFTQSPDCTLFGLARTDAPIAEVFTCNSIPSKQAMAIMAHEVGHLLSYDRYGIYPAVGSDLLLVEGLATYGAAKYWLAGSEDLRGYVRVQRQAGVRPDLQESYRGIDTESMNANYFQWASFVAYLMETCSPQAFHKLYITGDGGVGSADYLANCGRSINDLEHEWLAWVER